MEIRKEEPLAVVRWREGGADALVGYLASDIRFAERKARRMRWFVGLQAALVAWNVLWSFIGSQPEISWVSAFWCALMGFQYWGEGRSCSRDASLWRFAIRQAEADDDSRAQMLEDELAACRPMGKLEHKLWGLVLDRGWKWVFWLVPRDIAANRMLLSTRKKYAEAMAALDIMDSKGGDTRWLRYRTSGAWDNLQRVQNMEDN